MRWRPRLVPLLLCVLTLAAGLTVDATAAGPVADKTGDVLYALLVVAGLWLLRPEASALTLGGVALAWCAGVELLQLSDVPRAMAERVPLARLVLGTGFDALDLPAYALGCAVGAAAVAIGRLFPRSGGRTRRRRLSPDS